MPNEEENVFMLVYNDVFKDRIDKNLKSVQETANLHPDQPSAGGSIDFSKDLLAADRMIVDSDPKYDHAIKALETAGINIYIVYGEISKKLRSYILKRMRQTDHEFLYLDLDKDGWLTFELLPKKLDDESEYQRLTRVYVALVDKGIDNIKLSHRYMNINIQQYDYDITIALNNEQLYLDIEDCSADSVPINDQKAAKWLMTIITAVAPFLDE